jgi:hypothetical protein
MEVYPSGRCRRELVNTPTTRPRCAGDAQHLTRLKVVARSLLWRPWRTHRPSVWQADVLLYLWHSQRTLCGQTTIEVVARDRPLTSWLYQALTQHANL